MFETRNFNVNVDRLMHDIRETVARRHGIADEHVPVSLSRPSSNGKSSEGDPGSLSLQPAFQLRQDNHYHINDLLKFHGEDFIRNSYRALLLREPDDAGLSHYLGRLASGRVNKIDVLASLHFSPEGQRARVKIAGLSFPVTIRRLGRLPMVGYLIRLIIGVARLPLLLEHQRQVEFYLCSQQQRIVEHLNQGRKELSEAPAKVSGQFLTAAQKAAEQEQAIELSAQQHRQLSAQQLELGRTINSRFTAAAEYVDQSLINLAQQIKSQSSQFLQQEQLARQLESQLGQLLLKQKRTHSELMRQEMRLTALLREIAREPSGISYPSLSEFKADDEDHNLDALYASLEDRFRGERDEVRQRLQIYLPILKDARICDGVLDIGCGRGEWLELLRSEEHTSELQSLRHLVCRLLLEKKKTTLAHSIQLQRSIRCSACNRNKLTPETVPDQCQAYGLGIHGHHVDHAD